MYLIMSLVLPKPTGKVSVMLSLSLMMCLMNFHMFAVFLSWALRTCVMPMKASSTTTPKLYMGMPRLSLHESALALGGLVASKGQDRFGGLWQSPPPRSSEFQMTSAELTPHVSVTVPTRIDGLWGFASLRLSLLDSLYICTQLPANIYIESWSDNPSFCEATAANTTAQWEVMQGVCQWASPRTRSSTTISLAQPDVIINATMLWNDVSSFDRPYQRVPWICRRRACPGQSWPAKPFSGAKHELILCGSTTKSQNETEDISKHLKTLVQNFQNPIKSINLAAMPQALPAPLPLMHWPKDFAPRRPQRSLFMLPRRHVLWSKNENDHCMGQIRTPDHSFQPRPSSHPAPQIIQNSTTM